MNKREAYAQLIVKRMIEKIKSLNLNKSSIDDVLFIIKGAMRELASSNMMFYTNTVKFNKHAIGSVLAYELGDVNFCIKEIIIRIMLFIELKMVMSVLRIRIF